MAAVDLTRGAIAAVSEGRAEEGAKPVVQVWDVKLVNTQQSTTERYRMLLSDGVHMQQAMLATQMNGLVKSGALQKHSIVQLNEFICNVIQNRRIIIVINLEVLFSNSNPIGEPKLYDNGPASQNRAPNSAQSSSADQPTTAAAAPNPQAYGGLHPSIPNIGQNVTGGGNLNPKTEPVPNNSSFGGIYGNGLASSRNTCVNIEQPKAEQGVGRFSESYTSGGNQNQRSSNQASVGAFRPPTSYGRPAQPAYQQPPPLYTNRGPIARNEAPARIIPIAALNPYQGRWTIKARVTSKSELRRYNNPRGEGKVFSFDLLDANGGEIRVTCFNMVADQFYDLIEVGKVYLISKGSLKPAQKNFNHLNNEYEIFLESQSVIQPCLEEDNIPKQQFNFRPINEIEALENNSMVDIIGIVTSINPAVSIMRKNGTETNKQTLQLKDMSNRSVEVTLWGNFCSIEGQQLQSMCDSGVYPVLAIKAGRISDFGGKSVGTISSSQLLINPEFPEAHNLRDWYNREGKNVAALSISRDTATMGRNDVRKTVSQIKDEGLGRSEKPDWITIKAIITFVKGENFCYTACPLMVGDRPCNKKVNNNGDGTWHCDRCDQSFPECDYRYLLQFQIQDHTGMTWVTAFQECGEEILGVPAKQLYMMKFEEQDDLKFAEIVRTVMFQQYLFKLKVKEEIFSDEQRVKSTVVKAEKVNPSSESRYLLGLIEKLTTEDPHLSTAMHGTFATTSGVSNVGYSMAQSNHNANSINIFGNNHNADGYRTGLTYQSGQPPNEYGGNMKQSFARNEPQVICSNCGSAGHSFQNCVKGINRQGQSVGSGLPASGSNFCFKCQQPGHWASECPGLGAATSAYGSSAGGLSKSGSNVCYKCHQPGHWANECPGLGAATPAYGSAGATGRYAKQHVGDF